MKCDNCRYKGFLPAEKQRDSHGYLTTIIYSGIRCTNSDCIFFRSPCKPLIEAGLDNCKGFEEIPNNEIWEGAEP